MDGDTLLARYEYRSRKSDARAGEVGRHRQVRCNWGNEKMILTQGSDRKQKMLEESITVQGGHLERLK